MGDAGQGTACQPPPARPIRAINYLAYGANDILGAGAMAVLSGWILYFYTTFCGLTAFQAASIFAVARVLDSVVSPTIGHFSDVFGATRLGRRFGRRRFFLMIAIPLVATFALMWVHGHSYGYYLATYVVFEVVYAIELIPYETLAAEMSDDYRVRARFAGSRILFGQVSAILAGILPGRIVAFFGQRIADTFFYMGLIFSGLFMLVVLLVYLFTWERDPAAPARISPETPGTPPSPAAVAAAAKSAHTFRGLRQMYVSMASTLRIRAFRLHLGMYLGGYISQDIFNAAFTYFMVFALGSSVVSASNLLGMMAGAQLVAVGAFIYLCVRIDPAPSYRLAVGLFASGVVGLLALYVLKPASSYWVLLPVVACGLGRGGLNYIPWNLYNYMADVDEIVTGTRREGVFAGVMTFSRKAAQALAVMAVGLILDWGGFKPAASTQNTFAVATIVAVLGIGTLLLLCFGGLVSVRFGLNERTHSILREEISRFRDGATGEPSPINRAVVEDLSGLAYGKLWGAQIRDHRETPSTCVYNADSS